MGKYVASHESEQVFEQALKSKIDSLPKEMQPQRDLWLGIERAIEQKEQAPFSEKKAMVPMAWAASIIAAVLLTWYSLTPSLNPSENEVLVKNLESNKEEISGSQLVDMMQENFSQQKKAMLVSFGQPNIKNLPEKMQSQLVVLAQARTAIEKALLADENNVDLLNLLRFTQQQELDLLEQLSPYMNDPSWHTI